MNKDQKGFTVVEGLLIVLTLAVIGFGGYYVWHTQHKPKTTTPTTAASTTTPTKTSSNPTAGWRTYSDGTISFQYPQTVTVAKTDCPPGADSCVSAKASSDSGNGLIFYEKASTLSAKDFATQSYSSDGTTVTTSNTSSINGFDTYTAQTSQTLSGTTYTFWETYISKSGEVAYSNYPYNSTSATTYKQIVSTLKLAD
jgi:hypothetical protein